MIESVDNANWLAHTMVFAWFPLVLLFYTVMRPTTATCWAIVGAALLMPEYVTYDMPTIPSLTKRTVPYYATFLLLMFKYPGRFWAARPLRGPDLLFVLLFFGLVGTVLTNGDPTGFGPLASEGLGSYDIVVEGADDIVRVYFPFLVGRAMFTNEEDLKDFLRFLVAAALLYWLPAVYETIMSPIIHRTIYGFRPVDFLQAIKGGAYRPSVMYSHGLGLARFFVIALIAAVTLYRAKERLPLLPSIVAIVLLIALVAATRSMGATIMASLVVPFVVFTSVKVQRTAALVIAAIAIAYPVLFATGLFPTDRLIDFGYSISEERGTSLEDRFEQEILLNDKVAARPIFGWGGYQRSHEFDPDTLEDITTVDGEWLVIFSQRGAVGFSAWFGLYLCSIWLFFRHFDELPQGSVRYLFCGACLTIAQMAFEMTLNSPGSNPQFFFAGVLYGSLNGAIVRARVMRRRRAAKRLQSAAEPVASPRPLSEAAAPS